MKDPESEDPRGIEFSILGPLEVRRDGVIVDLPGGRRRQLLVELLLSWGRPLGTDVIVDRLWGESPPPSAPKTVQKCVWDLRRLLGSAVDGVLATEDRGYVLRAEPETLDSNRFEALVSRSHDAPAEPAVALLEEADGLWRGPALVGFDSLPEALIEARRLEELRLAAAERRLGLLLDLDRHAEALPELERLTGEHPMREGLWAHLMVACARGGRRHDALAAFQRVRRHLAEELGIEPSARLAEIEQLVLAGDERLMAPPAPDGPPHARVGARIPTPLSSFIGRSSLLSRLEEVLAESRLVTLSGAGGSGKTRVAIETARLLERSVVDNAWFVDLSTIEAGEAVVAATAAAIGLPDQPGTDPAVLLLEAIGDRAVLLVLDNCEHVLSAAVALVELLLSECPNLRILSTSRESLGVPGEHNVPVPPLDVPDGEVSGEDIGRFDAVKLFTARARELEPDFDLEEHAPAVVEICTRLDGVPLALELAAAQVSAMTPADITDLLEDRFRILAGSGGRPPRHATLQATIDWSYERLADDERLMFSRAAVFAGSFDLAAATAIVGGDGGDAAELANVMARLVRRSMVERAPDHLGRARYRLLETLRAYGRGRLAADGDEPRRRLVHARYFRTVVGRFAQPRPSDGDMWQVALEADHHNLQAALGFSTDHHPELAADLAFDLSAFWTRTDQVLDGLRFVEPLTRRADLDPAHRAAVLCCAAELRSEHGEALLAEKEATEALDIFGRLGDEPKAVRARYALGRAKANGGEFDEAATLMAQAQSSFAAAGDVRWATTSTALGSVHLAQGDTDAARREYEAVLTWARRHDLAFTGAKANWLLGVVARHGGDADEARFRCHAALETFVDLNDRSAVAHVRMTLGDIARLAGDREEARALYDDALVALTEIGDRRCTASATKNLGDLERDRDDARAAGLYLECLERRVALGDRWGMAEALEGIAGAVAGLGQPATAAPLLANADEIRAQTGAALPDDERTAVQELRAAIGGAVSPDELDRLWTTGAGLSQDEVMLRARAAVRQLDRR